MSSAGGPRAVGTDGNDFRHRQRISANIKLSVQYKFYLKLLFCIHLQVLFAMWIKVGGELVFNEFILIDPPKLWRRMDLPSAYPWEYVWCLSFIPLLFALASFPKNKGVSVARDLSLMLEDPPYWELLFKSRVNDSKQRLNLLSYHYYGQFLLGILPCSIGLGGQIPELWDYLSNTNSRTPTFGGDFPMVVLWYIFFLIAFQIHIFAMYFAYHLSASWSRDVTPVKKNE